MNFNTDPKKQDIQVCFPCKTLSNSPVHRLSTNLNIVKISESYKRLGLILDSRLKLNEHLKDNYVL